MARLRRGKRVPLGTIRIKEDLHRKVSLLLLDPMTGKIEYGAMNFLVEQLLGEWVDKQRKDPEKEVTNE